jgi:hypothetical protein
LGSVHLIPSFLFLRQHWLDTSFFLVIFARHLSRSDWDCAGGGCFGGWKPTLLAACSGGEGSSAKRSMEQMRLHKDLEVGQV